MARPIGTGHCPQQIGLLEGIRSLGLLDDLEQTPALGGGQRAGLHDGDEIASPLVKVLKKCSVLLCA